MFKKHIKTYCKVSWTTRHATTACTSNMAAVITIDNMTSLPPYE